MEQAVEISQISIKDFRQIMAEVVRQELGEFNLHLANEKKMVPRIQAAKQLNISVIALDNWRRRGIIVGRKLGGKVYFMQSDIEQAAKEMKI